jgi:hypothetical protein
MRSRKDLPLLLLSVVLLSLAIPSAGWAASAPTGKPIDTVAIAPAFAGPGPITVRVGFGASEPAMVTVHLWAAFAAGVSWHDTGLVVNPLTGESFQYEPEFGPGIYYFATVAEDGSGPLEPLPTGSGDATTVVDWTAPESKAFAPRVTTGPQIQVFFQAKDDWSGVAEVHLWVACPNPFGPRWQDTGLVAYPQNLLSFLYTPTCGNGRYYFATVAVDRAGNVEALPSGDGDTSTFYSNPLPWSKR